MIDEVYYSYYSLVANPTCWSFSVPRAGLPGLATACQGLHAYVVAAVGGSVYQTTKYNAPNLVWIESCTFDLCTEDISRGRCQSCQHGAFSGVGAIVASFVTTECPKGRGMWGIFGKPLKRAIWNTPGLHAVLTVCLRFLSVLYRVCAACCPLLLTGTHHVCLQIHATCCCLPRCTTATFGAEKGSLWGC